MKLEITVVVKDNWDPQSFDPGVDVSTPIKLAEVVKELMMEEPKVLHDAIRDNTIVLTVVPINDGPGVRYDSPYC